MILLHGCDNGLKTHLAHGLETLLFDVGDGELGEVTHGEDGGGVAGETEALLGRWRRCWGRG